MSAADGIPRAYALLTRDRELEVWQWRVVDCPYCHGQHVHGGGQMWHNPRTWLDVRVAHCRMMPGVCYQLVEVTIEEVPDGTAYDGVSERPRSGGGVGD